jgi:hypothetical protein
VLLVSTTHIQPHLVRVTATPSNRHPHFTVTTTIVHTANLLRMPDPKDNKLLQNFQNRLLKNAAQYLKRSESSTTLLWEHQLSHS